MTYAPPAAKQDRPDRGGRPGDDRSRDARPTDPDVRIDLIELPDEVGDAAPVSPGGGFLAAYARRGFAEGRRRGFREAVALTSLAVEELIADRSLGEVPPSVLRQLAAALTARLAGHAPAEGYVEGGLGI